MTVKELAVKVADIERKVIEMQRILGIVKPSDALPRK